MPRISSYRVQVDVQAWTPQGKHYHTDLMGSLKQISTRKTTSQSYGTFALVFTSQQDSQGSWADKLPFRTYVEIRSGTNTVGTPPMLMRGLVDSPGQTMQMPASPAGPQREVTISGRDLGAIPADWQVLYLWGIDPMATFIQGNMQNGDALSAQLGVQPGVQDPNTLLKAFISKLVNGTAISGIQKIIPQVPTMQAQVSIPSQYQVNFLSLQPWQGAYSSFLDYFASPPWGEDFYLDTPTAAQLVVRQTPYKEFTSGQYPLPYGGSPESNGFFPDVTIAGGDVTAHDLTINGANQLYTYYSTTPDLSSVLGQSFAQFFYVSQTLKIGTAGAVNGQVTTGSTTISPHEAIPTNPTATGTPTVQTQPNQATQPGSNPYFDARAAALWGIRQLQLTTPWVATLQPTFGQQTQDQVAALNTWLVNVYRNNDLFSSGTITCHGHQDLMIGRYLVVTPNPPTVSASVWEGYIQSVTHQIDIASNSASWQTTLGLVRGRVRGGAA